MEGHRFSHKDHALALKVLGGYIGQHTKAWENIDSKNMGVHQKIDPLFSVLEIGWEAISAKCWTIFLDLELLHIEDVCKLVGKYFWQFEDWTGNNGQEIMDRKETQGVGTYRSASGCTSSFLYFIGMFVPRGRSLHPITQQFAL